MFDRNLPSTTNPDSPRCGARLRQGGACPLPPTPGKRRCFQHGGARGSGAAKGNRNAHKHGLYTREAIAEQRAFNAFIRDCLATMREFEKRSRERANIR
jgi:hypothetical protein